MQVSCRLRQRTATTALTSVDGFGDVVRNLGAVVIKDDLGAGLVVDDHLPRAHVDGSVEAGRLVDDESLREHEHALRLHR